MNQLKKMKIKEISDIKIGDYIGLPCDNDEYLSQGKSIVGAIEDKDVSINRFNRIKEVTEVLKVSHEEILRDWKRIEL